MAKFWSGVPLKSEDETYKELIRLDPLRKGYYEDCWKREMA